jgi:phage tail sheath protein FI
MTEYKSPGVYVQEVEAGSRPIEGVGTAVAAFVGLASQGEFNTPTLVTNWSQFRNTFGEFSKDLYLAHAVYGYFLNGGGTCYVVRIGQDGGGAPARAALPSAAESSLTAYEVTARDPGPGGNDISIEVSEATEGSSGEGLKLVIRRGADVETFDNLSVRPTERNVVTVVNAGSKLIEIREAGRAALAKRRPATGTFTLAGGRTPTPARLDEEDYIGDPQQRTGFAGLEAIDEITMLCVPDLMAAYMNEMIDLDGVTAVQGAMIAHCENMRDRLAILDVPFRNSTTSQDVLKWRVEKAGYDSPFSALYWPWIKVYDPAVDKNVFVPPCGHVAGIWSRTDQTRGVHKAPANEVVQGAIDVATRVTTEEQGLLNPVGINVIRSFPARGIRVWGARTLATTKTEWKYVNVRRLFNFIEESILEGTSWVVFEPNDQDLWQRIRRTVTAFLMRQWRNGALFGAKPEEAFYVKCDEETNPPDVIDAGQVIVEIGIAPVKPAEFVVFRIAQYSSGAQVSE